MNNVLIATFYAKGNEYNLYSNNVLSELTVFRKNNSEPAYYSFTIDSEDTVFFYKIGEYQPVGIFRRDESDAEFRTEFIGEFFKALEKLKAYEFEQQFLKE